MFRHRTHNIEINYSAYPLVVHKPFRRQNERFRLYAPAKLVIGGIEQEEITLRDVSARGIRLTTSVPLKVNDEIEIRIDKPTALKPATIKARVIWCTSKENNFYEAGVSSSGIDLDNFTEKIIARAEIGITTPNRSFKKKLDIDLVSVLSTFVVLALLIAGTLRIPGVRENAAKRMLELRKSLGYHLEGVVYDPQGTSMASINDRIVSEGEALRDLKVEKVNDNSVVIKLGNRKKIIRFSEELR